MFGNLTDYVTKEHCIIINTIVSSTHSNFCVSVLYVQDSVVGTDDLLKLTTVGADLEAEQSKVSDHRKVPALLATNCDASIYATYL